jgi:hypothetical protein
MDYALRLAAANQFHRNLVYITPAPCLARFERGDDRMFGAMKVFGRVPVLRVVATTDVSASAAQS